MRQKNLRAPPDPCLRLKRIRIPQIPTVKRTLAAISFGAFIIYSSGCVGTQSYLRILEMNGAVRTDVADNDSYDYKVLIENRRDFGWDGGNRDDRLKTVHLMFQDSCRKVKVIGETAIPKGEYLTGKKAVTWVMKIKCLK